MEAYILFLEELQKTLCTLEERLAGDPSTKYTNDETISIYKEIVDLCEKHGEVAKRPYSSSFRPYSSNEIDDINNLLESVQKKYKQLKQGYDGEETVYKTLQLYDDRLHILRNYSFRQGEYEPEIDELVLTEKGIFCIEVKNWSGQCTINQAGYLVRENAGDKDTSSNIAFQTEQHVQNLRKLLKECSVNIPSESYVGIICWSNKAANVTNKCPSLVVCYTNELANQIIKRYEQTPSILSSDDLQKIIAFLEEAKTPAKKFALMPTPFSIMADIPNVITSIRDGEAERIRKEEEEDQKLKERLAEQERQNTERQQLIERYGMFSEFGKPMVFGLINGIPNYYGFEFQKYCEAQAIRLSQSRKRSEAEKELFELAKEFYLEPSALQRKWKEDQKIRAETAEKERKLWEETLSVVGRKAEIFACHSSDCPVLCGYINELPNFYGVEFQTWAVNRSLYFSKDRKEALRQLYQLANKYYNHPEDRDNRTLDVERSAAEELLLGIFSALLD